MVCPTISSLVDLLIEAEDEVRGYQALSNFNWAPNRPLRGIHSVLWGICATFAVLEPPAFLAEQVITEADELMEETWKVPFLEHDRRS